MPSLPLTPRGEPTALLMTMTEELNKSMYYGATSSTFEKAGQLRNKMTEEEFVLWERLKGKQICNVRFRRQHPLNVYIVDFYCHEAKLVVELDGKIHLNIKEYDKARTLIIKEFNIGVIRFSNFELNTNINKVINQIAEEVKTRLESKIPL